MTEQASLTREQAFLRTRIFADGVRYVEKGASAWDPIPEQGFAANVRFILDGTGMVVNTQPNPRSRLDCVMEGDKVTITEMGKVLCTGKLVPRAPWRDIVMSDGTTAESAFQGTDDWSDIVVRDGCHTAGIGKACKFCIYSRMPYDNPQTFEETLATMERQIEATSIAVKNGWHGLILFVGGAQSPERRGQWLTDLFEAAMAKFYEFLDEKTLSEYKVCAHVYPPDDLSLHERWKSFGINTIKYDLQVMDPAYFKAICPGRGSQKSWFEAQEAAVEVFGRDGGVRGDLVGGLEPMESLLAGIDERLSKGVHCTPGIFYPLAGTPLEFMSPPSAEWYMEMYEQTARIYRRHGYEYEYLGYELPEVKLSSESLMKDLLADDSAVVILRKVMNASEQDFYEVVGSPQQQQAMGLSLKQIAPHSQGHITDEMLKTLDEELAKL